MKKTAEDRKNLNMNVQAREDLFMSNEIGGESLFALRDQSLERIGPVNEKILEISHASSLRAQSPNHHTSNNHHNSSNGNFHGSSSANSVSSLSNSDFTRRTSKRKLAHENSINSKRRGDVPKLERLVPKVFPPEYPFNKEGYR